MGKVLPNSNQLEAINTIEGPLLISAGPGTGKTATLVDRYANMVNNYGIKPENIFNGDYYRKSC